MTSCRRLCLCEVTFAMQQLNSARRCLWALALLLTAAQAQFAPYSGAPFLTRTRADTLPSRSEDEEDATVYVDRLLPNVLNTRPAHACDDGNQADKNKCLNVKGRECMWTRVEGREEFVAIQDAYSYCLPCMIDDEEIPCWNVGAMVGGMQVTDCVMSCPHQTRIRQPEYTCSDESGFITEAQCWDRGSRSGSQCMFIAYNEKDGQPKSSCAPCYVDGTGGFSCPEVGGAGPTDGSKVTFCNSQCDSPCPGPPLCPPTVAPPPPPPPPSPGVVQVSSPKDKMLVAPMPVQLPTVNPYAVAAAAMKAAKAAGWVIGTPPPPKSYFPVVMYRTPADYAFTPGPPASSLGFPAAPPPAMVQLPQPVSPPASPAVTDAASHLSIAETAVAAATHAGHSALQMLGLEETHEDAPSSQTGQPSLGPLRLRRKGRASGQR
eukprot:gnl/TRDRNA2_/TRDRNA2_192821_c0_seq1.p1 gnl/TRDRNA2_/TRDRNA2_192821_c0~~gnl/TRDRNA2_/TRDRNA2_192821_c0_seq1.p1  ORF type:complete len:433 (-),score=73.08 gnl/TRDRNA2_/TRDRNA2_192821_c0_seq1:52-1350(-)